MNIHNIYSIFMKRFRPKRAKFIGDKFPLLYNAESTVLDVGGGFYPWDILQPKAHVKILNLTQPIKVPTDCKWEFVVGDGTNLQFPNKSFDLVFSNSVIEHVGDWQAQQAFANEMLRVGKKIYFQTPNKWFPVEPHLITLFIHWFPFSVTRHLIRYFSVWGIVNKPTQKRVDEFWSSTRLLTHKEVLVLFPDCEIKSERVLGLTKSFIVVM